MHQANRSVKMLKYQIQHNPSFLPVLLSILRHFPLNDLEHVYKKINEHTYPVLLIWVCQFQCFLDGVHLRQGMEDATVPASNGLALQKIIPRSHLEMIPNALHMVHRQYPERVTSFILQNMQGRLHGKQPL